MARILVVDDNPLVHRIAEQTLGAEGHHVEGSLSGSDVIARISQARPDLLLLDTALPDTNVSEVCEAILTVCDLDHVRVVLLAGPLETIDDSDIRPGIHSIVQKPLDGATLFDLVKDLSAPNSDDEDGSDPSERVVQTLVSEALGQPRPQVSREAIREQIDEAVSAAVPAIVDRITDRLVERLKQT